MVMVNKDMAPEVGGGSNGADNVFKNTCIKLTGPSAEKLGEAFYGPGIVVLQEIKGVEKGAADAEDPGNSKELIINRIVRGALMQPPPGHRAAEGGEQVTEREGAMAGVKPAPVPPTRIIAGTSGVRKTIKVLKNFRIVLLGRRGAGKSSLANTIFGEDVFKIHHTPISGASEYQTKSKSVHGRRITLVDTPGFFDTDRHEEEMKTWITGCSPGPHVFLIVLKVEKFTEQEKVVIDKMCHFFSEEALKYAVVVFTHGDQLPEGMKIEEFVGQEKCLSDLVKKCGGRCHVVDIKNSKNQVAELLSAIDKLVIENKGGYYTNKMLQAAERKTEETGNKESVGNMPEGDTSKTKNKSVSKSMWIKLTGPAAESMVEAFSSPAVVVLQNTAGPTDRAAEKVQAGNEAREGKDLKDIKRAVEEATKIEDKEGDEDEAAPKIQDEVATTTTGREEDEETAETGEDAATDTEEVDERAEESNEKQATATKKDKVAMTAAPETKKVAGGASAAALGGASAALGGASAAALGGASIAALGGASAALGGASAAALGGASAALGGASAAALGGASAALGGASAALGGASAALGGASAAALGGASAGAGAAGGGCAAGAAGGGSAAGAAGGGSAAGAAGGGSAAGAAGGGSAAGSAGGGSAAGSAGGGSAAGAAGGSAAGAAGGGSAAGAAGGSAAGAAGGGCAAGAAGVVGSAAGAAGVGSVVGIFVGGVFTGIATAVIVIATAVVAIFKNPQWALKKIFNYLLTKYSRRAGIILLVVTFFLLLLLSFCVKVPIAGTFLLWFGVLLMLLLSVGLFLLL